jgi:hypothetical protein
MGTGIVPPFRTFVQSEAQFSSGCTEVTKGGTMSVDLNMSGLGSWLPELLREKSQDRYNEMTGKTPALGRCLETFNTGDGY